MSRYKNLGGMHFDKKQNSKKAKAEHLTLLAAAENIPIDDILDEGLTQGAVMTRLAAILHGDIIPAEVIERRRAARLAAREDRVCRICSVLDTECEGDITRHHFVPRWLMLRLENYQAYSARRKCTIPICVGRHRDLHLRDDNDTPKSIAQFMTDDERAFAQKMLEELEDQHPAMIKLMRKGDSSTYEAQLIKDFDSGLFALSELPQIEIPESGRATG